MGNVVGRRYRYGAGFVDRLSGVRFEGHHPMLRPDLWKLYLNEAEGIYRDHGFEGTLRRRELEEGNGVSLFFLGFGADGKVVAGVRCHGPLDEQPPDRAARGDGVLVRRSARSPGCIEPARRPRRPRDQGRVLEGRDRHGSPARRHDLAVRDPRDAVARCRVRGRRGVRRAARRPATTPARARSAPTSVPFPDERYRTVAVRVGPRAEPRAAARRPHQLDLRLEAEQLSRRQPMNGRGPVEPLSAAGVSWRPVVLDVQTRAHREVLQVLREDPSLQVLDRYTEQRAELEAIRPGAGRRRCSTRASAGCTTPGDARSSACWPLGASPHCASTGTATSSPARSRPSSGRFGSASSGLSAGHSIAHVARDGGPRRRAAARRLRHDRALEPQPAARDRARPRRQQGGRRRAAHRRDRPLPARRRRPRGHPARTTSASSSTASTSSSRSATRSTSSCWSARRRVTGASPSSWRRATAACSTSSASTSSRSARSSTACCRACTRRTSRGSRSRPRRPTCCG